MRTQRRILQKNTILSLPNHQETRVTCFKGQVWITQRGDRHDYLIADGHSFQARAGQHVVVQARCETELELSVSGDTEIPRSPLCAKTQLSFSRRRCGPNTNISPSSIGKGANP